uniref:Uncharacterized protein n=1 Tax=Cucumis melo TaxID=3656 RepID=A0A9I9EI17_CUCME
MLFTPPFSWVGTAQEYEVVNLRTTDLLFVRWHMKTQEKTSAAMYLMLQTNLSLCHQEQRVFDAHVHKRKGTKASLKDGLRQVHRFSSDFHTYTFHANLMGCENISLFCFKRRKPCCLSESDEVTCNNLYQTTHILKHKLFLLRGIYSNNLFQDTLNNFVAYHDRGKTVTTNQLVGPLIKLLLTVIDIISVSDQSMCRSSARSTNLARSKENGIKTTELRIRIRLYNLPVDSFTFCHEALTQDLLACSFPPRIIDDGTAVVSRRGCLRIVLL